MRRWLSILLLVFMPLQFSWAAMATYCEHESGAQAKHVGHHEHKHQESHPDRHPQPAGEPSESSKAKLSGVLDVADCHFHCQCMADLPGAVPAPVVIGGRQPADWNAADAIAPVPSRPERPQWVDHA